MERSQGKLIIDDFPIKIYEFKKEKDGKSFSVFSLSRSYKDRNGEKKYQSISCFPEELLRMANICQTAYNLYIAEKNQQLSNSSVPTNSEPEEANSEIEQPAGNIDDEIPF